MLVGCVLVGVGCGTLFWSGGADGGAADFMFENWARNAPGSNSCATLRPDGQWVDADCNQQLGYVCQ